ncbi:MAG TPA: bifunctional acetate--CoA ligase family protein/GNAT family N-acetyltransferase [Noviherbaspirillum sp.]|uniref:bifunctional acetate--CoA ligase family protein/GNAT family N-acetyltransferase n=1 Tax=Noviherbaspirillum sp. TaxID=1926288 RepID=UPI002D58BC07|nr:bifunctional acetate--CoA ligase family protein/GNAT family N-acetyltransferase [Noviherbaspirillum sp.]HYD95814.1 bifunctional acetate--CoA ligase family protein/GNAT family N-acetyltransferase [Noviherbaspirillum sp.]
MTVRNLKHLFEPQSIAVVGASGKPNSIGATVLRNLLEGGFAGGILPVNPKYGTLSDLKVYASVAALPEAPDLAIVCTPAETVPGIIADLGKRGTRAAIVLSAGLNVVRDLRGRSMKDLMLKAARPHLLRILGPNCVGMLVPSLGLNASYAHTGALPGRIAFVSQSGAMMAGVLDWAKARGIGFSKFVSLGDGADVDFGDMLDYLATDADTHAILLYVETIRDARKFMSAARSASRSKPTLVIKAGRAPEGATAAASHTGALAGSDDVYDAAIRRAGMLRVYTTLDLFDAVETLARARPLRGDRLAIVTNGGGPGVLATDHLIGKQGRLASLSPEAMERLNRVLPPTWSRGNPVDILGDAPIERYLAAMDVLMQEKEVDATLLIHAPTAMVDSADIAAALAPVVRQSSRNVLACWLGGEAAARARAVSAQAGIPTYDTPEEAVRGFMQIVQYNRNQQLLMEVPAASSHDVQEDRAGARRLVQEALAQGRDALSEPEAKQVLAAYGVPVVRTRSAATVDEAVALAADIGFPVALKILSPDITHKSDVGGVVLDLEDADSLRAAANAMGKRLAEMRPGARLEGFSVQSMVRRPEARELIVGVATDPVFGPVILFGQGGIAVEVTADHAIGLPPLNMVLAKDMISRTRVAKLLAAYRHCDAADIDAICHVLIQISHLVIDIPEIVELDINPLLADAGGVIALDARMRVVATRQAGVDRLAIHPYPEELEEWVDWKEGRIQLRPIKPEDAPQHVEFFSALTPEDVRLRMFVHMRALSPAQLARMTQIDYNREMAFIATRRLGDRRPETLAVARVIFDPDNTQAEFAISVRSDLKGKGLGRLLMEKLIRYCRARGTQEIVGETLSYNQGLLGLVRPLGFSTHRSLQNDTVLLKLPLQDR